MRPNHAELRTQYEFYRTPAVPGPIEILSEIEGKKGRIMKKTGEKE